MSSPPLVIVQMRMFNSKVKHFSMSKGKTDEHGENRTNDLRPTISFFYPLSYTATGEQRLQATNLSTSRPSIVFPSKTFKSYQSHPRHFSDGLQPNDFNILECFGQPDDGTQFSDGKLPDSDGKYYPGRSRRSSTMSARNQRAPHLRRTVLPS